MFSVIYSILDSLTLTHTTPAKRTAENSTQKLDHRPLILLYHKLHGSSYWFFKDPRSAFRSCEHQCRLSGNISDYTRADMAVFEAPRTVKHFSNGSVKHFYYEDEGLWPVRHGNPNQVRLFYAREPQSSGVSSQELNYARFEYNYTISFLRESDIFYPYGFITKKATPDRSQIKGESCLLRWVIRHYEWSVLHVCYFFTLELQFSMWKRVHFHKTVDK